MTSGDEFRVGCPMWAHKPWVGTFLSPGAGGRELVEYSRRCNAVEGNTTFYAEPAPRSVARWAAQAPLDFRFAFKLPRTITHERRLRNADDLVRSFLMCLEPLGERIGPLQIQLPPSFGPESIDALTTFTASLPSDYEWAVELRHAAFFSGGAAHRAIDAVLCGAGIGRVVLDTRPLYRAAPRTDAAVDERRTKPRLPVRVEQAGRSPIIRVIGEDGRDGTMSGLLAWIPQVVDWIREGRRPYVFVHQPENRDSPALARELHEAVRQQLPTLRPLPEPLPVAPRSEVVGQDSLFE